MMFILFDFLYFRNFGLQTVKIVIQWCDAKASCELKPEDDQSTAAIDTIEHATITRDKLTFIEMQDTFQCVRIIGICFRFFEYNGAGPTDGHDMPCYAVPCHSMPSRPHAILCSCYLIFVYHFRLNEIYSIHFECICIKVQ